MKVEDCIVSIERRSLGGCLDLAFVFGRHFAGPITRLMLMFAIPSCVLVWLLTSYQTDMLIPSIVIFLFFNALMSGAMVASIGPQVFGVPITTTAAIKGIRNRLFSYLFLSGVARLLQVFTGFCMVFPSVFVTAYFGHLPEVVLLERTKFSQVTQRLSWLGKGGGYSRNLGRLLSLLLFWFIASAGLFRMIDMLSDTLFNAPIFFNTISDSPDMFDAFMGRIIDDPRVLTLLQVSLWMPYPIIRLAWFFCYLDQRIRNECWDLELQFRIETNRLEEQAV